MTDAKDYLSEIVDQIQASELNNDIVECILVNPDDYNNYITQKANTLTNVNYDAPPLGLIEARVYGVRILTSNLVPKGSLIKKIKNY